MSTSQIKRLGVDRVQVNDDDLAIDRPPDNNPQPQNHRIKTE